MYKNNLFTFKGVSCFNDQRLFYFHFEILQMLNNKILKNTLALSNFRIKNMIYS